MKQSVDLMNSMKLMNSRHSNPTPASTSLARRALLLLSLLIMSVGSAWGAETLTKYSGAIPIPNAVSLGALTPDGDNKVTFAAGNILTAFGSTSTPYVRFFITNSDGDELEGISLTESSGWATFEDFGTSGYAAAGSYATATMIWSGMDITVTVPSGGLYLHCYISSKVPLSWTTGNYQEPEIDKHFTYTVGTIVDPFEGELKSLGRDDLDYTEIVENPTTNESVNLTLSQAWKYCTNPVYARFQVINNGAAVDLSSETDVLNIEGATVKLPDNGALGYYIYNASGISDSDLTATLKATALNYPNYEVICYLSLGEESDEFEYDDVSGKVTSEPNWDVKFTYKFKNDFIEIVDKLPTASLSQAYAQLNIHNDVLSKLGTTEDDMKDSWYGRWFVRNKETGAVQPLAFGEAQADGVWSAYIGYNNGYFKGDYFGGAISSNYATMSSAATAAQGLDLQAAVTQEMGYLQIYAPTEYAKLQAASDYEIVYEVTDEYTSGTPEFKLRYVFQIPSFENEPNAGMETADKPQTVTARAAASITLSGMPTNAVYARFYLTDKDDNILEPGSVLSVTSGIACSKTTSGIYLYNNGSVLSPTVTIAAPKAYKTYKVVGLFATSTATATLDGSTVIQEPKWDMQYTYTFDYTISTTYETPQIEWDATAMEADASDADIDTNWKTSLAELSAGQAIKWWVEDGGGTKQELAIGTERQDDIWNIGLPAFTVEDKVATLSGMTAIEAAQLESWVKPNVYAPANKTYADISSYKIVCEVYTNNDGTDDPNARYTFSIHKGFVGSLKSTATDELERVLLEASATTKDISVELPAGTKYVRAYLANTSDEAVAPIDKLAIAGEETISSSVDGYSVNLGSYLYNADGLTSPATVTLTLSDATLDDYHVVVLTSKDAAVTDPSGNVTSEPDWDTKTTYWFKYPAKMKKELEANVEWSAQSMQLTAPAIEDAANLGAGYLENNKAHYTMQWQVVDKDGKAQKLRQGTGRTDDGWWTVAINGDPFTLATVGSTANGVLTVTNNANLSTTTWSNWAAPVIYAPSNLTMKAIDDLGITFVYKFYEDDNAAALNEDLCSMTYTVYINRQEQQGKLKDGGLRLSETITDIDANATEATIHLKDASKAFKDTLSVAPTYARIYLTKNDGTPIDPTTGTEQLTDISGATPFTTATLGYYLQDEGEDGLTLPDATLTLPAGKFNFYYVVVAMSKDKGETGHTGTFARKGAASVESIYEPDYDLIYTIKFAETSEFPGTLTADAFSHSNEVLVKDETVKSVAVNVAEREKKILAEYEKASFSGSTGLASSFHVRYYVTKKNDEGEFEKIPNSEKYITPVSSGNGHQTETDQGLYWNSVTKTITHTPSASEVLNVTFNRKPDDAPELTGSWEDYKIYVVMAKDLAGQTKEELDDGYGNKSYYLTHEPDDLTMVNTYSFFTESTFQFVHDKGASGRDFITPATNADLQATVQQYEWDNSESNIDPVAGDIRQGVHTVEYDVYVNPACGEEERVILNLPFENYTGTGNNLEPAAYIRWYDWNTDINSNWLEIAGAYLEDKEETNQGATVSRGFFMLNNSKGGIQPTHTLVGVTFKPKGLSETVNIACDVSKYYDGIYSSSADDSRTDFAGLKKPYLMHEPTLSTRYIFHVHPASEIATSIQTGQDKLEAGGSDMFQLAEDNGRVSVAIKDANTRFSVRAKLPVLGYYFINNGGSQLECDKITWWAYYEDETGIYRKDDMSNDYKNTTARIKEITVDDLKGNYTAVSGSGTKNLTAAGKGQRFHIVGYVGNGSTMAPAIHYEMNLVDAPAYKITELPLERTEAYLRKNMTLQATVDFDNEGGLSLTSDIASQLYNHSTEPLSWDEAQYGFCYPDVRRIYTNNAIDYVGISPIHGDYMLLKSVNKPDISKGDLPYYIYKWWVDKELLDYTYVTGVDSDRKYGSFLYVDASDESRTIAQMRFTPETGLCVGSDLCFTGYIADLTNNLEKPQVMATVYGIKANGERVRVVSFHSSNLSTTTKEDIEWATWYQMYGRVAIPNSVDLSEVVSYVVDIDNYATNTNGADYAVDQLQFYTSNAKLKVKQQDVNCGDDKVKMNLYIDAEAIQSYAGKSIYWRICDEDGNPMSADMKLYDDAGMLTYGTTEIPATVPATIPTETTFNETTPNSGYFIGSDGATYFSLASKYFALEQGKQYYVSVYQISELSVTDEDLWGDNSDPCDIYSPVFIPKMMYLEMQDGDNKAVTSVSGDCSTKRADVNLKVVLQMPDDEEVSGFKPYDGIHFDFFLGTLAEYSAYSLTEDPSVKLENALKDYRGKEGGATTYQLVTTLSTEYESGTGNNYKVIKQAIDAGLLFLDAASTFHRTVTGNADNKAYISALPIEDQVDEDDPTSAHICTPLEFVFDINISGSGPQLTLGFDDVDYSSVSGIRVVRVGREQLLNMQKTGGFLLHIPVNTFKTDDGADDKAGTLNITSDGLELLAYNASANQTTDTKVTANVTKVATFEATAIDASNMYVSLNFHGDGVTKPTFYEGFAYRMFFQVKKLGGTGCEGNVEFLLKVVPEFVTWNPQTGSTQWNSDANWKRSERAELNKSEDATQNTATAAQGDGTTNGIYQDNADLSISKTPNTYVPMKFTYVTLPSNKTAPKLINLTYDSEDSEYIYNNIGTGATDDIQYDLMVRYTEQVCQSPTAHGDVAATDKVYDCEKFYGNWAKEIYLKPDAQLLNQQYLTYEKAWVEKELTAKTWTLMSTPLQNTYAGDMYVPYNSSDATKNGRQLTEAFQPIKFNTTTYSRTKYPIYQKGWTQGGVYVYTKMNDIRASKYSANIPGGVSTVLNQWSHEYNDVTVPYSTWTAFAIRAHKKAQSEKTLIRLPKADTSYGYYQWDNTSPMDGKLTQTVSKTTTGKLLTDGTPNITGVTHGVVYGSTDRTAGSGEITARKADIQEAHGYQLVGNPYLCSIDMAHFISENSGNLDTQGYWTYDHNSTGSATTSGYIEPMQSFFVKMKSGVTGVVFKPSMMRDKTTIAATPSREFTLTAANERGRSAATVVAGEEEKSVETLFDSNLEDVPMVYTVADGQAVSLNQVTELSKPIAFGVTCNSNEPIDVTFSDIEQLTDGEVIVVDAVDGKTQTIYEGDTFTVQPNDYGRYFLTFAGGTTGIEEAADVRQGVVVSVRGREVTVTAGDEISSVRALSMNGATMYQDGTCGTSTSFSLAAGVYIIQAESAGKQYTVKVMVK